jgi:hypothetical protein
MYICIPVGYIYVFVSSSSFSLFPLCVVQLKAQPKRKKKKIPITLDSFTIPRDYNKRRMFAMAVQGARGPSRNDFFFLSSLLFFSVCVFPSETHIFVGRQARQKLGPLSFFFGCCYTDSMMNFERSPENGHNYKHTA